MEFVFFRFSVLQWQINFSRREKSFTENKIVCHRGTEMEFVFFRVSVLQWQINFSEGKNLLQRNIFCNRSTEIITQ
jgi:hypothetical protein